MAQGDENGFSLGNIGHTATADAVGNDASRIEATSTEEVASERSRLEGLESHNAFLAEELTERRRSQLESEDRLLFATEAGRLGVWDLDVRTQQMTASPRCNENFGRPRSVPFSYADLQAAVHPADRERRLEAVERSITTGADYDIEYRVVRLDGTTGWVQIRGKALMGADGRAERLVGVSLDITDRTVADLRRRALVELSDVIRDETDPDDIAFEAARILGETLEVSRAGYGTVDLAAETITIERDWNAPGIKSLAGKLHFRDYGSYVEDFKRGATVVFADAEKDPRTAATADALKAISAQSVVNMPVTEQGGLVALLYLNHATARPWSDDELAFVREMAERTRVAVERRRVEQELRDLAATLERRVEERTRERDRAWKLSRDLQAVVDENGTFIAANEAWATILGWRPDEVVGRSYLAFNHHDDHTSSAEALRIARGTGLPAYEIRCLHADGSTRLISWVAASEDGLVYASGRDVTEEREREAVLRDTQDFARLALSAVGGVGVWTYDAGTDAFSYDAAIADLYGLDPARGPAGIPRTEFLGNVHPDDRAALSATMAGGMKRSGDLELEYRLRHPDGSVRWVLSRGHTYHDEDGRPLRRTGVGVETTKQRQTEEALRQAQKMEAVGQLTGGLAHDFNNLLTGVMGSIDLMQTRLSQGRFGELEKYAATAQGAAKRAAALTHRLLAFSRRQTLAPKPVDANRLVAGMEELIRRTVGPAITVEFVGAGGLWKTLVDPPQLENALLNLSINARDAMPEGGRLTIETGNRWLDERAARERDLAAGQHISVCVSDTGSGMPADVVARAFDPFFTTKPIGLGTGLGLSMIYGFAKQSGGMVRIYSEVGQGTMVCLYLPRHYGTEEGEQGFASNEQERSAAHGETVLVVDDEPSVRMLVTDILEDAGFAAIEAKDGAAALKVLETEVRIDLLITDVGLPNGMNGRQVADAARALRPALKVLFITGYAENAVLSHEHLEPGMEIVTKPFAMDVLAERIFSMLKNG